MKVQLGGDCEGELYLPGGKTAAGAVVILHERYGLVQHTLDLAQRLAADGYVALAPDLFSRWQGDRERLRVVAFRLVGLKGIAMIGPFTLCGASRADRGVRRCWSRSRSAERAGRG